MVISFSALINSDSLSGIKINCFSSKEAKTKWVDYIRQQQLKDWVHLYQTVQMRVAEQTNKVPGFKQAYDVFQTPTIYLLDEQKRIVAKKINPEQVDEFLQFKQTNQTSKHP